MGLLDSVLGGAPHQRRGGMSPLTMALLGLLAYRTFQGKGRLADMLGRKGQDTGNLGDEPRTSQPGAGLGGMLGGLLSGGSGGGILSGGLGDLLSQFQQKGYGEKAESWIGTGPNQPVEPNDLEQVLGAEKIEWLMRETGMSREELLAGLSRELPDTINKLTPTGRIPTEAEAERML